VNIHYLFIVLFIQTTKLQTNFCIFIGLKNIQPTVQTVIV